MYKYISMKYTYKHSNTENAGNCAHSVCDGFCVCMYI